MLPRRLRLTRGRVPHTSKEMRAASPHFSVSVRTGSSGSGAIISKKTEKTSVGRHRLKRRILSIIEPHCSEKRAILVYARAGSSLLPYRLLKTELSALIEKLLGTSPVR